MLKVLIAEDDRILREAYLALLADAGYQVCGVRDGTEALAQVAEFRPDLLLLDIMMPGLDGFAVCRRILADDPDLPVLFLTALGDAGHRVQGLELGADDYIEKTATPRELLLRVAKALRRSGRQDAAAAFDFAGARVDPESASVTVEGVVSSLSSREVEFLRYLKANPGRTFTTDHLLARFWGPDFAGGESVLRVFLHRLRAKLGPAEAHLRTLRGVGLVFD